VSLIINHSSHTVYLERDEKSEAIEPGETKDATLPYLVDGELFVRASDEVVASYQVDGRVIVRITFRDR
jgi:hypothetical protein